MKKKKEIVHKDVENGDYRRSHEPLHKVAEGCQGCEEYRSRRNRNTRAGKVIEVNARADTPLSACHECGCPSFAGHSEQSSILAWNQDINRAAWSLEEMPKDGAVPQLCPRCRRKAA